MCARKVMLECDSFGFGVFFFGIECWFSCVDWFFRDIA